MRRAELDTEQREKRRRVIGLLPERTPKPRASCCQRAGLFLAVYGSRPCWAVVMVCSKERTCCIPKTRGNKSDDTCLVTCRQLSTTHSLSQVQRLQQFPSPRTGDEGRLNQRRGEAYHRKKITWDLRNHFRSTIHRHDIKFCRHVLDSKTDVGG